MKPNKALAKEHFNQLCELQKKLYGFGEIFGNNYVIPDMEIETPFMEIVKLAMALLPHENALIALMAIVNAELDSLIADQTLKLS